MPASIRMKVIGIASTIIKLVNKPERECTENFSRECRKKIWSRNVVRYTAAQYIGNCINNQNDDGCNNKIAEFQALKIFNV